MHHGFEPGTDVGGYLAGDVIGAGGASVVQRAWDPRIGRTVALKVLDGAGWDPTVRERFEREVRMGGGLTHPNIVPVLDAGDHDGRPYLVMQCIEGPTLAAIIARDGPLRYPRVVKIASDIAAALDYAHGRGVIHRDVKPGNILVLEGTGSGGADHAYLADFGITRAVADAELAGGGTVVLGTPAYIAPEQRAGTEVDGRADVYALACVIFEMLSGTPPFGLSPSPGSHPIPPLSGTRRDVPPTAEIALRQALVPDRTLRPSSAGELVAALATRPVAMTMPIEATPAATDPTQATTGATDFPTTSILGRPGRRSTAMVALFAGVFLVTVIALIAFSGLAKDRPEVASPVTPAPTMESIAAGIDPTPRPTRRTPGPTPTEESGAGGGQLDLDAAWMRLRRQIPDRVESECEPYNLPMGGSNPFPVGTVAYRCLGPAIGIKELRYYRFPDGPSLDGYWETLMEAFAFGRSDLGCWLRKRGETTHAGGRLACEEVGPAKSLYWTDDKRHILGYVEVESGKFWTRLLSFFRSEAIPGGAAPVFNAAEEQLLAEVPDPIVPSCVPYPADYDPWVPRSVAVVDCWQNRVEEVAYYRLAGDGDPMQAFRQRMGREKPRIPTGPGGCDDGEIGDATIDGIQLFCWIETDPNERQPRAKLRWIDLNGGIYGVVNARESDTNIRALTRWWRLYALRR